MIELFCVLALAIVASADVIDDAQGAWIGTCTGLASYNSTMDLVCAPEPGVNDQEYLVVYDGNEYSWYTRTDCNTLGGEPHCLYSAVGTGTVAATGTSFQAEADDVGSHCFFVDVDTTTNPDTMYETGTYVLPDFSYTSDCPSVFLDYDDNTCTYDQFHQNGLATYSCVLTRLATVPDLSQLLGAQGHWIGTCVAQAALTDPEEDLTCTPAPGVTEQPYGVIFSGVEWSWATDDRCETIDDVRYCLGADSNKVEVTPDGTTFVVPGDGCFWLDADGETMHESGIYTLPDYEFLDTCPTDFTEPEENTCVYTTTGQASYSCTLTKVELSAASSVGSNVLVVALLAVAAVFWSRL